MTDDFLAEDFPSGVQSACKSKSAGSFWESHRDVPEKHFLPFALNLRFDARLVRLSLAGPSLLSPLR